MSKFEKLCIVVSYKGNEGYYKIFDNKEVAESFLQQEEFNFRTRELYDNINNVIAEWCKEYDSESDAEDEGYYWDDFLQAFTRLRNKSEEVEYCL